MSDTSLHTFEYMYLVSQDWRWWIATGSLRDRIHCITKYQVGISNVLAKYWRPCTQRFRESPNTCIRARITEYYTYVGGFTQTLLKYVYYRVFKRVLMLYHSLIHQECISENTAVYLDVLQRIQWKLCNTPNTLSIHNWYIVFHYLGAAGGTGSRIRPGYVSTT